MTDDAARAGHQFTDRRGRNLCDVCDRYEGAMSRGVRIHIASPDRPSGLLREAQNIIHVMVDRQTLTGASRVREIIDALAADEPVLDGKRIADAVRRVSNRELFKYVNIDWTALGAALVEEFRP